MLSVHNTLLEFIFFVTSAACDPLLCEIHDVEHVFAVFARILNSEMKPLLVAFCVRVNLHIKVVVIGVHPISVE